MKWVLGENRAAVGCEVIVSVGGLWLPLEYDAALWVIFGLLFCSPFFHKLSQPD